MATYDGFGNRLQQSITKEPAPSHSVAVNGLNNQMIGQSYDLNGNLFTTPGIHMQKRRVNINGEEGPIKKGRVTRYCDSADIN